MLAIFKRELRSYFYSPIAYVLAAFFLIFGALAFYVSCVMNSNASVWGILQFLEVILLMIIPILTMKVFADEKRNGTEVLLITSPINITKIVIGKFLGAFFVFLIMTALSLIYVIIILIFGSPYIPAIIGAYLAFVLFGALLVSIGVFVSSLTESQVIAAIISLSINIVLFIVSFFKYSFGGIFSNIVNAISPIARTENYFQGLFGFNNIIFFIVAIALFIFLTVRNLEKKRWSKG